MGKRKSYIHHIQRMILSPIFILCITTTSITQTISVPLSHWSYDAIERWEIQEFIQTVFNNSKPFTRIEMAEYVSEVWQVYEKQPEPFYPAQG